MASGSGRLPFMVPKAMDDAVGYPDSDPNSPERYVQHLELLGREVKSFSYEKLEPSLLVDYLVSKRGPELESDSASREDQHKRLKTLLTVTFKQTEGELESNDLFEVISNGILMPGRSSYYKFLGYSSEQRKTKTCYMLEGEDVTALLQDLVEISESETKEGLVQKHEFLFSAFDCSLELKEAEYGAKPDEKSPWMSGKSYVFSKGCGLMSKELAQEVQEKCGLEEWETPSVVHIRYQGFEGTLVISTSNEQLRDKKVMFRQSMKKFDVPTDSVEKRKWTTLGIVDFSRPFQYGYLDSRMVRLFPCRGIPEECFEKRKSEFEQVVEKMCSEETEANCYLAIKGKSDELAKLNQLGISNVDVKGKLESYRKEELAKVANGKEYFVLYSREVFGVCDPFTGDKTLRPGECFFQPKLNARDQQNFESAQKVVVVRVPAYYPGDIRVLKLVKDEERREKYGHLHDCIVFPARGKRPHANEAGGGSLGGDKYFVCWDKELIPTDEMQPYNEQEPRTQSWMDVFYTVLNGLHCGPRVGETRREIYERQTADILQYFADYNSSKDVQLRAEKLYTRFAEMYGPDCSQCVQLNKIFRGLVDADGEQERLVGQMEGQLEDDV